MNRNEFRVDSLCISNSKTHVHEGLECLFVVSGNIDLELDDKRYHMGPDDIVVINMNQLHVIQGNSSALIISLHIEKDYLLKECPEMAKCFIRCNSAATANDQRYAELKKTLIQMKLTEMEKGNGSELNIRILLLRFIYILVMNFKADHTDSSLDKNFESASELSNVLQHMYRNYYQSISLKNAADLVFMSPQYFSKYFKKKTGESFFQYLQKIRLERALKSLLYGNDSILQIALDNGFANPKAFSAAFAKQYQDTPSAYRKRYGSAIAYESNIDNEENEEKIDGAIIELLRYRKKYDLTYEYERENYEVHNIDLRGSTNRFIQKQSNLLNIGKLDVALRSGFINDLKNKANLGIQYVYFCLLDQKDMVRLIPDIDDGSWNYHILQAINIFQEAGLIPMFKISCEAVSQSGEAPLMGKAELFSKVLRTILEHYQKQYTETWMFEICVDDMPAEQAVSAYKEMRLAIKKELPKSQIGLFSISNDMSKNTQAFAQRLSMIASLACMPDFITFSVFPNNLKADYMPDVTYYPISGYHKRVALDVKKICETMGAGDIPLFAINWNTLTGGNRIEVRTYFRSALILQAMMELNGIVEGVGFWYDSSDSYFLTNEDLGVSLALYAFESTKRPAYFVAELFARLGGEVLWETENAIAIYKEDTTEWIIVVWNPIYLNPFYYTGQSLLAEKAKTVRLEIKGLEAGQYKFKHFCLERSVSSSLSQYISSGFPNVNDKDAYEYMQSASGKQMMIFEEKLSGGVYKFSSDIDINGLLMLVINRVN